MAAHISFFVGGIPTPVRVDYPIDGQSYLHIWRHGLPDYPAHRSSTGRHFSSTTGSPGFVSSPPPETTFSIPPCRSICYPRCSRTLSSGTSARNTGDDRLMAALIRDREETLPLHHIEELTAPCLESDRFFLLVNCSSTHFPYTTPGSRLTVSCEERNETDARRGAREQPWSARRLGRQGYRLAPTCNVRRWSGQTADSGCCSLRYAVASRSC